MVVLGSVLGLLTFLFDPFATFQLSYPVTKILLLFICSLLLIPLPIMEERSFNLFGLNAPAWSLFLGIYCQHYLCFHSRTIAPAVSIFNLNIFSARAYFMWPLQKETCLADGLAKTFGMAASG